MRGELLQLVEVRLVGMGAREAHNEGVPGLGEDVGLRGRWESIVWSAANQAASEVRRGEEEQRSRGAEERSRVIVVTGLAQHVMGLLRAHERGLVRDLERERSVACRRAHAINT